MSVINTNVKSMLAQSALNINNRAMSVAMEQLSTGSRINSAKDDAAGLSISQTMTAQIRGLDQAVRNANDGIGLLQTAEGAMLEQSNMLQRMRELAFKSIRDTLPHDQREHFQQEFRQRQPKVEDMRELAFKSIRDTLPHDQRERFQEQFRQRQQQVADMAQSISSDPPGGLPGNPLAGFESTALRSPETAEA